MATWSNVRIQFRSYASKKPKSGQAASPPKKFYSAMLFVGLAECEQTGSTESNLVSTVTTSTVQQVNFFRLVMYRDRNGKGKWIGSVHVTIGVKNKILGRKIFVATVLYVSVEIVFHQNCLFFTVKILSFLGSGTYTVMKQMYHQLQEITTLEPISQQREWHSLYMCLV